MCWARISATIRNQIRNHIRNQIRNHIRNQDFLPPQPTEEEERQLLVMMVEVLEHECC